MIRISLILVTAMVLLTSCGNNNKKSDAYGNFEATEIIVSSESAGKLLSFTLNEGDNVKEKQLVGIVDTIQLSLKREQVVAQKTAVSTKVSNIMGQIDVLNEQKKNLLRDKTRIEKLLADGAATKKQLDDIDGAINVAESQINSIKTQNSAVFNEVEAYEKQIAQLDDQIKRSYIYAPINGLILEKYVEPFEVVTMGKALFKIADVSYMDLRAYVSGAQLPQIKTGQKVNVLIDKNETENTMLEGEITWISQQAEFTPKIIQTKEERVNLVYAIKVRVSNDGSIKIGMPGEVVFK